MTKDKRKFQIFNVIVLSFSHFAHDIFPAFLPALLPELIKKLGLNYSLSGFLNVVSRLPSLLNPFVGMLIDKKGGKLFIILGPTITAISITLLGVAPSYGILVLLLLVAGLNSTFFHVPVPVLITQSSADKKGLGMSIFMVGGELARSLGPVLVLAGISWWGLEGIWRLIGFGIFSSLLLFFSLRKIKYPKLEKTDKTKSVSSTFGRLWRFFAIMFLFLSFVSLVKMSLTFYLPTYLNLKTNSLWLSGGALSILEFAGLFGALLGGFISDKIGRSKTLLIVWLSVPLLMQIFIRIQGFVIFPILILIGLFMFETTPVLLAYVHDIKCERNSLLNSLFMITNFIANALGTMIVGVMADKLTLQTTFQIVGIIGFLALPFIWLMNKEFNKIQKV